MIAELLNTAYSNHEIVGSYLSAALRWFEAGGDADLEQLAEVGGSGAGGAGCGRQLEPGRKQIPPARLAPQEWAIGKPALLTFDRLQPGEKPVSAGAAPEGADPVVAAPAPAA